MTKLLLIESPGKLKKLSQILGSGWKIEASMGHVRELANDGEDSLGFEFEGDRVRCRYQPRGSRGKQTLAKLQRAVQDASQVYLATDPDREGETIAWHLQQALRIRNPLRVTYTEITRAAVQKAIANPRPLDEHLIAAGRTRDCLDKLVGYKGSPLLWQLKNGAKSMGRVQSATLHLICQREQEIVAFVPQDYWSVWVVYREGFKAFYRASLNSTPSTAAEPGEDDAVEKKVEKPESDRVLTQEEADRLVAIARSVPHQVATVECKRSHRSPPPAFITSTLQQAAGARYKWKSDQTMQVAQKLYEGGYITYMRTDSVALSPEFCTAVRQWLTQHDPANVPAKPPQYRSKAGAQEAHEAIRPTEVDRTPDSVQLAGDESRLYDLIWHRAIASQCCPAQLDKTRIITRSGDIFWEARGQIVVFPGYTRYWNNLSSDVQLPTVQMGQVLHVNEADSEQKQTQPPPRYTEPKLVQLMERKGIGRPSTYAPTIKTLKDRDYVQPIKGGVLQPTALGLEVDRFLSQVLPDLLQPEFTAKMELTLDAIAVGQQDWERYLVQWYREYFHPALIHAKQQIRGYIPAVVVPASPEPLSPMSDLNSDSQEPSFGRKSSSKSSFKSRSKAKSEPQLTDVNCPKCGNLMSKIPSKSKKLAANHFLKCESDRGGCDSVMFWSDRQQQYELPYGDRQPVSSSDEPEAAAPNSVLGRLQRRASKQKSKKSQFKLPEVTETQCPKCGNFMSKIPSKSKKLSVHHFLKCEACRGGCDSVMFWSDAQKEYVLPYGNQQILTPHSCPICQSPLEEYHYTKAEEEKRMLRCSEHNNRRTKCKDVAFFWSKERWWSPKFGEL
jgi:DNA topoisomerase-1